jgi:hypothetical protein
MPQDSPARATPRPPPRGLPRSARRKSHEDEDGSRGQRQREALVELHVVTRHQLSLGGEGLGLGAKRAQRQVALRLLRLADPERGTPAGDSCRRG